MNEKKTEAVEEGIEMGIFREGSAYHGRFFRVGLTEDFLDIYDEHRDDETKREESIRKSVLESYRNSEKELDNELLAIIILILGSCGDILSDLKDGASTHSHPSSPRLRCYRWKWHGKPPTSRSHFERFSSARRLVSRHRRVSRGQVLAREFRALSLVPLFTVHEGFNPRGPDASELGSGDSNEVLSQTYREPVILTILSDIFKNNGFITHQIRDLEGVFSDIVDKLLSHSMSFDRFEG